MATTTSKAPDFSIKRANGTVEDFYITAEQMQEAYTNKEGAKIAYVGAGDVVFRSVAEAAPCTFSVTSLPETEFKLND